jgi:hypothetical protein
VRRIPAAADRRHLSPFSQTFVEPELMRMPAQESEGLPPRVELSRLQHGLLKAALLGEQLPGGGSARLADQAFILRHPQIYLSDENLAGAISLEGLPKPLRIVSGKDVRHEADVQGDVAYLRFLPPHETADGIWLTLEARLYSGDPSQHSMGLSSVQVKLRKVDGGWELTGESRGLAS